MAASAADPPIAADVDLRTFAFMPLDVARLRDSDLAASASGDEFRAAVLLWAAAWHQVPAGSVPADERSLAMLAGFGRDVRGWRKVSGGALRGFAPHSDGRLYHAVIVEKALEAWARLKAFKERSRKGNAKRWKEAAESLGDPVRTSDSDPSAILQGDDKESLSDPSAVPRTGTGTGTDIDTSLRSVPPTPEAAGEAAEQEPDDAAFEAWWERYPRARRGAKGPVRKKWLALVASRKATPEALAEGLDRYLAAGFDRSEYAKMALTWLNGEGWTVEEWAVPGDVRPPARASPFAPAASASGIMELYVEEENARRAGNDQGRSALRAVPLLPGPKPH